MTFEGFQGGAQCISYDAYRCQSQDSLSASLSLRKKTHWCFFFSVLADTNKAIAYSGQIIPTFRRNKISIKNDMIQLVHHILLNRRISTSIYIEIAIAEVIRNSYENRQFSMAAMTALCV